MRIPRYNLRTSLCYKRPMMPQPKHRLSIVNRETDREVRDEVSRLRILLVDSDPRPAALLRHILFSLGIRHITHSANASMTLDLLRTQRYDFIITEWDMVPFDGIMLTRLIRTAYEDGMIHRETPIIMLTGYTDPQNISAARDAGVTEFLCRPFSAGALSQCLLDTLHKPRQFIETDLYVGPCRRRQVELPAGMSDRRIRPYVPPDSSFRPKIAALPLLRLHEDIVVPTLITPATEVPPEHQLTSQGDCVPWARAEIAALKDAFRALEAIIIALRPKPETDPDLEEDQQEGVEEDMEAQIEEEEQEAPDPEAAHQHLLDMAEAVRLKALEFDYALGAEITTLLLDYAKNPYHCPPTENHLLVIHKHIEAIAVAFNHNVEQHGRSIAQDLIRSLHRLVEKLE